MNPATLHPLLSPTPRPTLAAAGAVEGFANGADGVAVDHPRGKMDYWLEDAATHDRHKVQYW